MIHEVYSVHDIKAGVFNPPQYFPNEAVALREYRMRFQGGDGPISRYPKDYRLYSVGRFDDAAGVMLPLTNPKMVMEFHDILKEE
jgi:hypothetical protein